jgi:hypothetical protein
MRGLATVLRALRHGGWLILPAISSPGSDFRAALARLRNTLWGGGALLPERWLRRECGPVSPRYKSFRLAAPCVRCLRGDQPDQHVWGNETPCGFPHPNATVNIGVPLRKLGLDSLWLTSLLAEHRGSSSCRRSTPRRRFHPSSR